jgi:tripartite-type tricarboxylate transporter receptor subunit TctC
LVAFAENPFPQATGISVGGDQVYARALAAIAIGVLVGFTGLAGAQSFPSKPVKIIVPFAPGGAADIMARVLGESMSKGLGQPVVVENRPGAGAVLAYELVAKAPSDGYTILVVAPSFVIGPAVRRGLTYDPLNDFKALGQTISLPMAVAVNPSIPVKTLPDLIAYARSKPDELSYGTPGAGTIQNLFGEMLKLAAHISITHVPYQGGGAQVMATVAGHLPMVVSNVTEIAPFAMSGKVRAIVVTTPERADALPDVPTVREAGYPQLEATNWAGLVVPRATPPSIIARLAAELARALRDTEVQEKLRAQGMLPVLGTPEQFAALLESESARYSAIVRAAGVKLD